MTDLMACVKEFHDALRVAETRAFPTEVDERLNAIGHLLVSISQHLEASISEPSGRHLRAHLTLEETGEWLLALSAGDEEKALDALADRLYVLVGDAVMYDLPLIEAFIEVHRSNMTKKRALHDEGRVRDKGDEFVPPDLRSILKTYRFKKGYSL